MFLCPAWQPRQTTAALKWVPTQVSAGEGQVWGTRPAEVQFSLPLPTALSKLGGAREQGKMTEEVMGTGVQSLRPTNTKETYISLKLNKLANTPSSNVEILLLLKSLQERRMGQGVTF